MGQRGGGRGPCGEFRHIGQFEKLPYVFFLVRGGDVDVALADNSLMTALRGNGNSVVTA